MENQNLCFYINFFARTQKLYFLITSIWCFYINLEWLWKNLIWDGLKARTQWKSEKHFVLDLFLHDALSIPRKYWEVFKTFLRLFLKYQHAFLLCLFLGYVLEISLRLTREVKSLRNLKWSCTFFDIILVQYLIYFCLPLVSSNMARSLQTSDQIILRN